MAYDIEMESKKQDLGRRLVEKGIYCCVSSLFYNASQHQEEAAKVFDLDEDELRSLWETEPDYEEAATQNDWTLLAEDQHTGFYNTVFVKDNERAGTYEDACTAREWELMQEADCEEDAEFEHEYDFERTLNGDVQREVVFADDEDDAWEALAKKLGLPEQEKFETDEEDEAAWKALCEFDNIETDDYRSEVYEHWAINDWLASKLRDHGQTVVDVGGLTVWCRCTTGQAICLDYVIQQIALELWGDELQPKDDPSTQPAA